MLGHLPLRFESDVLTVGTDDDAGLPVCTGVLAATATRVFVVVVAGVGSGSSVFVCASAYLLTEIGSVLHDSGDFIVRIADIRCLHYNLNISAIVCSDRGYVGYG